MINRYVAIYDSPIGPLYPVVDEEQRICRLDGSPPPSSWDCTPDWEACSKFIGELQEYFAGKRRSFTMSTLYEEGSSDFSRRVWDELKQMPYGMTLSYSALAERLGQPAAARAVGNAVAANSILLVIPCHRIIPIQSGNNRRLNIGSFRLGSESKRYLLGIEGVL